MDERRKSERIDTHLPAQWESTSGVHRGTIINGSAGGCFVLAQVEEPGDEPLKLAIQLPNGNRLQMWGEVAYHLPTEGFGLHFNHSSDEGQAMLNVWLDYLRTMKEQIDGNKQETIRNAVMQPAL